MKKEEIMKLQKTVSEKGGNEFVLDLSSLIINREKELTKTIPIAGDDSSYHRATIGFGWDENRKTSVNLNISKWHKGNTYDSSQGQGHTVILKRDIPRKNFNLLLEQSKICSEEYINKIINNDISQKNLNNPFIS